MQVPTQRDESPKYIWNPLLEDFTVQMAGDDNQPQYYTARSQQLTQFPAYIARHVAKHLAQHLVFKRTVKTNYQDEYEAALKEVQAEL